MNLLYCCRKVKDHSTGGSKEDHVKFVESDYEENENRATNFQSLYWRWPGRILCIDLTPWFVWRMDSDLVLTFFRTERILWVVFRSAVISQKIRDASKDILNRLAIVFVQLKWTRYKKG